ncbi:alcohol acetyltransferase [Pseudogracilibacillus auburnensis]|uniref:NRPS condensation-like uncharacterized protein n=1 Tax=Pseudogracilibacillus auburnensis TaxID=1494959 RepID=A0A2V3VXX8_9BACI|nr:alcohol acetyltransferase [Pseudogracilibacillus auburnensis]PXW85558.1 NRPS condensation-like uncharacterized protein [Pseudogracilibacillus auburnensis]
MNNWYKLDNAAKIFPAVRNETNTSIFRVSMVLTDKIQEYILRKATNIVIQRYPIFNVQLHKGTFWNYLDIKKSSIEVKKEEHYPCHPTTDGSLLRVVYFNKKISVEIFHSLTDGSGAVEFLKTLVFQYLLLKGEQIDSEDTILLPEDNIESSEIEDSYIRYYDPLFIKRAKSEKTYQLKGTEFKQRGNNTIHGTMDAQLLNEKAKEHGATITAYLITVLIYSIYRENNSYIKSRKNIVIAVPVNLRKLFPSKTLRNFFAVINVGKVVNQDVSFQDLLAEVVHQLNEKTSKKNLQNNISNNVHLEKSIWIKMVPLLIKHLFLKYSFNNLGDSKKTMTLSNLGNITLPTHMQTHVERMEIVNYPTAKSPINCGICSVNNKLTITFTRRIMETDIIRSFFSFLVKEANIDVTIESNEWGVNDAYM